MKWLTRLHGPLVHDRRVRRLAGAIVPLLPGHSTVGDIGAGDGSLAATLQRLRPDLNVVGVDVLGRPESAIPIELFNGRTLPWASGSLDFAMLVDVLHHAEDPAELLREAVRVARIGVIIKDHYAENPVDRWTLAAMDWVGNAGYGVPSPFRYWSRNEWRRQLTNAALHPEHTTTDLQLYPGPLDAMFGRGLHFISRCRLNEHL